MQGKILSALLCAVCATAGTVNSTTSNFDMIQTGPETNSTATSNWTVSQFDPTLGTLTGVTLFVTGDITLNVHGDIFSAQPTSSISATFAQGTTFGLPGVSTINFPLEFAPSFSCSGTGTEFSSCEKDQTSSTGLGVVPGYALAPSSLTGYIGNGNVTYVLGIFQSITNVTMNPSVPTGSDLFFNQTEIQGTAYLQYTFTPNVTTPEPGSIALIGGGLVAIGMLSKKERRHRRQIQRVLGTLDSFRK